MMPNQPYAAQTKAQEMMNKFAARPIHIFGVTGAEGSAVLLWALAHDLKNIVAHDVLPREQLMNEWHRVHEGATDADAAAFEATFAHPAISWKLAADYETPPAPADFIFLPQSWFRYERNNFLRPLFLETLEVKSEHMARVWTLTRLYFALFPGKIFAVTGADGKTTTTRMLGSIMQLFAETEGVSCIETGNDRMHTQALAQVEAAQPADFLVLEVSDRQLSFGFPFAPDVAIVTNVTPNKHMDDYGGFVKYVGVKSHLLAFQNESHVAILNADDEASSTLLSTIGAAKRWWFSTQTKPACGGYVSDGNLFVQTPTAVHRLCAIRDLKIFGEHNYANALAAACAAFAGGVPALLIGEALQNFQPVPHRLQPVGTWRGITFIEDSAGGNPINIATAIRTFSDRNLVLLVGGYRPKLTVEEVVDMLHALQKAHGVYTLVLFGQVRHELAALVLDATQGQVPVVILEDLVQAFAWVKEHADELAALPAPVVCMTPGFESFDQYKDYRARAAHFVSLVKSLC